MMLVKDMLKKKDALVFTISPDATIYDALSLMSKKNIGALLVMQNEKVTGMFSERDFARRVLSKGLDLKKHTVSEMMTRNVYYVQPNQTVDDCMGLMTVRHIRHLPVMENEKLIGMLSIGDIVKSVISEKEFTIQQLEKYILGE